MENTEGGVVTTFNDEQLDKNNYTDNSNGDYKYNEIVKLVNAKIDSIKTEHDKNVNNTKSELNNINTRIKEINTRLQAIITALEQTKLTVDANNEQIKMLTEEKERLETELGKLKIQKDAVDKQLLDANQKLLENETEITNLTSKLAQKEEEINTVKKERDALTATGTQKEEEIEKLKEQYNKNKLADDKENEGKITALKTEHEEQMNLLKNEYGLIDGKHKQAIENLEEKEAEYESLKQSYTDLQERAQQYYHQVKEVEEVERQCADKIKEATEDVTQRLKPKIYELDQLNKKLEQKLEQAHKALDGIMTKLKDLKIDKADFTDLIKQINELLKTTETSTTAIEGHVGIENKTKTTEDSSNAWSRNELAGKSPTTIRNAIEGIEKDSEKNRVVGSEIDPGMPTPNLLPTNSKKQKNNEKNSQISTSWENQTKQELTQKALLGEIPQHDKLKSTAKGKRNAQKAYAISNSNLYENKQDLNKLSNEDIEESMETVKNIMVRSDQSNNGNVDQNKGGKRRKSKGKTRKVRKHATKKKRKPLVGGKKRKQTRKRRSRKAKKANKKK